MPEMRRGITIRSPTRQDRAASTAAVNPPLRAAMANVSQTAPAGALAFAYPTIASAKSPAIRTARIKNLSIMDREGGDWREAMQRYLEGGFDDRGERDPPPD